MSRHRTHFESHHREALTNRRRFTAISAGLIAVLSVSVGWYFLRGTKAGPSNCTPSGIVYVYARVYNSTTGQGASGATVSDNFGTSVGVDPTSGNYGIPECNSFPFTLHVNYSNPNGWSGPNPSSYVQQVITSNSYGVYNFTYTTPAPSIIITAQAQYPTYTTTVNTSLGINWAASNNPTVCTASGNWSGGKNASGYEDHSADTAAVGTKSYTLSCSNAGGSVASTVTVHVNPPPLPSAPTGLSATTASQTAINLHWTQATPGSGAAIAQNQIFLNNALINTIPAGTAFTDAGLKCGTTYTYYVKAIDNYGQVGPPSNTASANTSACPGQPPPPPPPPTGPPPSGGHGGGPTPPAADTTPPSVPANFVATMDGTVVKLGWEAATDNSGSIKGYQIDRSTDQTNWQNLASDYTDTSYSDLNAAFSTHYYYRLRASDNAGNNSDYTKVDITTGQFKPNANAGGTTITSDDGLVTVEIPAGALSGDASCTVTLSSQNADSLNTGSQHVVAGPYALVCKTSSGDNVGQFNQAVKVTITLGADSVKHYTYFKPVFFDDGSSKWTSGKGTYTAKSRTMQFATQKVLEFAVVGKKRTGIAAYVWTFIVIVAIALIFLIAKLRSAQRAQYEAYIRRKYYNF